MAADEETTRTSAEIVIAAILAIFTGLFGLRQKQLESRRAEVDVEDKEHDLQEKDHLVTRIEKLEAALDAKNSQIDSFRDKSEELAEEHIRLQLNMGKAIAKCNNCGYCNCNCELCAPCKNKKPSGGGISDVSGT